MTHDELRRDLEAAISSGRSLEDIVFMLRGYKQRGAMQGEVHAVLESLRGTAPDEAMEDRILEVSDLVAGSCSPHMRIWDQAV